MDSKYSVTITNRSGSVQSYVLFAETPAVTPRPAQLQTNIMVALRGVAGTGGQAYFSMPRDRLFAICGTSNSDGLVDDIQFEVLDKTAATLGAQTRDGGLVPGTTCEVVANGAAPMFAANQTAPALGELGAFCIRTKKDFSYPAALAREFFALSLFFRTCTSSTFAGW